MPQDNAADAGAKSEQVAAKTTESASTAVTPETPTETTSSTTSSLMDRLGVPAEVQQELESRKSKPEPTPETPAQAETTATEPTAEAESATEPESEEESGEEGEVPHKDGFVKKEVFDKRVNKLTKQKATAIERAEKAEELAEQLRAQLEATQPVTVAPSSDDLLADVTTPEQVEERKRIARATRDFYRARLNGFIVGEGTPEERHVSPEEVSTILGRAEDVLNEQIPRKLEQLKMRQTYDATAKKVYPDLFNPLSQDYQIARTIMAERPWLASDPGLHMFIGDYLRGARDRIAAADKKPASSGDPAADQILKARVQTPPIAPHVPAAQRSNGSTPSRKKEDQAMNTLAQDGSREALVAAIRAKREGGNKTPGARELVSV